MSDQARAQATETNTEMRAKIEAERVDRERVEAHRAAIRAEEAKLAAQAAADARMRLAAPTQAQGQASGSCREWIVAAGIADVANAEYIFMRESGCRPWIANSTGCIGLGQACPGTKLPCGLYDGYCQARYFHEYCLERYGSWSAARAFWDRTDARPYPGHWW